MKRIYKLDKFIAHLMQSAMAADNDFNEQRSCLKQEDNIYSLASDSLSMERINFSFNLKKYTPGVLKGLILYLRLINPNTIYDLCGRGQADSIAVHVSLKRNSAYEALIKKQEPDNLTKVYVRV